MPKILSGLLLCLVLSERLVGQAEWTLTAEVGTSRFSRAAHDTSTPTVALGAWRSTSYTLRLARESGRLVIALNAGYTSSPFGAWIDNVAVIQGGELALFELVPTLGIPVARTSGGAVLRLEAGPVLHLWTTSGEDPRTRPGVMAGATLALPLTSRWRVEVRSDLTLTGSLLRPEDESAEVTRESTMRRGRLALGVTRRL